MSYQEKIKNSTVMVTGGAGFIGSHLVTRLLELDVKKIYIIDSMEYGNQDHLPSDDRIIFHKFVLGTDDIDKLKGQMDKCDYLFHFAAQKHNQSIESPNIVYQANVIGTSDLYDLAGKSGVKKVVFSSSLYAHGSMHQPAMKETDVPEPKTIYGISKLCGERILEHFALEHKFEYNSLRFFFVYGPKQFPGMGYKSVIVKNFERILEGESPIIFGDGEQALDYIYIDDVVEAVLLTLSDAKSGELFHVGSGEATSIKNLTESMLKVSESDFQPVYQNADWTAGTSRQTDNSKIKNALSWEPKINLAQGLENTYNWLKETR